MPGVADSMSKLGVSKFDGSSIDIGKPYQDIPTLGLEGHRNNSKMRANRIMELVDVTGKTLLDLGCNVGSISGELARNGAKVTGIDHDADSIAVAASLYQDITFKVATIDLDFIKNLPRFNIIVWTSQFNWLAKQKGLDHALDCLWEIGKHCDTLVFETAGKGDGSAPLDIAQEGIFELLAKNSIFREIRNTGQWNDTWFPRDVFVLSKPLVTHLGFHSIVIPGVRGQIYKAFAHTDYALELKARTAMFLRALGGSVFPHLVKEDEISITMEWCGPRAVFISNLDVSNLSTTLKINGITHRDITPDNVVFNGRNAILLDPAYACYDGEITRVSHDLGGKFKCPHGFNDEYSLQKTQEYLLRNGR